MKIFNYQLHGVKKHEELLTVQTIWGEEDNGGKLGEKYSGGPLVCTPN